MTSVRRIPAVLKHVAAASLVLALAACSHARVEPMQSYAGATLPKPSVVVVDNFAVTPEEVKLDSGISSRLKSMLFNSETSEQQEAETGRKVAAAVSKTLVQEIQKLGLPAVQGDATTTTGGSALTVTGQLLSIDEGNRTRRNLIGLGAGKSSVQADTQLYYNYPGRQAQFVTSYQADSDSGRKPGAAETMGVGAATGAATRMAATSAGASAASETMSADVDDLGAKMAKAIAKQLAQFFASQGWIPPQAE
jgi:hypothetical protein